MTSRFLELLLAAILVWGGERDICEPYILLSRSLQRMQTVQLFLNRSLILCRQFGCRTSLCFTDQETQEENLLSGTSSFLSALRPICRSKLQDPFNACRQSKFVQVSIWINERRERNLQVQLCRHTYAMCVKEQFPIRLSRMKWKNSFLPPVEKTAKSLVK